ncbi:hypothetical protein GmHk_07G018309 [Glycine max]|nr:hypothetical protein GmHk_07G018309 [Glycine max]
MDGLEVSIMCFNEMIFSHTLWMMRIDYVRAMNEYDIFCCFSFLNVAVTPDGRWRRNMLSPNRLKDESLLKKLIFIFVKSLKIFFLGWHVLVELFLRASGNNLTADVTLDTCLSYLIVMPLWASFFSLFFPSSTFSRPLFPLLSSISAVCRCNGFFSFSPNRITKTTKPPSARELFLPLTPNLHCVLDQYHRSPLSLHTKIFRC